MSTARYAALMAVLFTVPAHADWGRTRWGADRAATVVTIGGDAVAVRGRPD